MSTSKAGPYTKSSQTSYKPTAKTGPSPTANRMSGLEWPRQLPFEAFLARLPTSTPKPFNAHVLNTLLAEAMEDKSKLNLITTLKSDIFRTFNHEELLALIIQIDSLKTDVETSDYIPNFCSDYAKHCRSTFDLKEHANYLSAFKHGYPAVTFDKNYAKDLTQQGPYPNRAIKLLSFICDLIDKQYIVPSNTEKITTTLYELANFLEQQKNIQLDDLVALLSTLHQNHPSYLYNNQVLEKVSQHPDLLRQYGSSQLAIEAIAKKAPKKLATKLCEYNEILKVRAATAELASSFSYSLLQEKLTPLTEAQSKYRLIKELSDRIFENCENKHVIELIKLMEQLSEKLSVSTTWFYRNCAQRRFSGFNFEQAFTFLSLIPDDESIGIFDDLKPFTALIQQQTTIQLDDGIRVLSLIAEYTGDIDNYSALYDLVKEMSNHNSLQKHYNSSTSKLMAAIIDATQGYVKLLFTASYILNDETLSQDSIVGLLKALPIKVIYDYDFIMFFTSFMNKKSLPMIINVIDQFWSSDAITKADIYATLVWYYKRHDADIYTDNGSLTQMIQSIGKADVCLEFIKEIKGRISPEQQLKILQGRFNSKFSSLKSVFTNTHNSTDHPIKDCVNLDQFSITFSKFSNPEILELPIASLFAWCQIHDQLANFRDVLNDDMQESIKIKFSLHSKNAWLSPEEFNAILALLGEPTAELYRSLPTFADTCDKLKQHLDDAQSEPNYQAVISSATASPSAYRINSKDLSNNSSAPTAQTCLQEILILRNERIQINTDLSSTAQKDARQVKTLTQRRDQLTKDIRQQVAHLMDELLLLTKAKSKETANTPSKALEQQRRDPDSKDIIDITDVLEANFEYLLYVLTFDETIKDLREVLAGHHNGCVANLGAAMKVFLYSRLLDNPFTANLITLTLDIFEKINQAHVSDILNSSPSVEVLNISELREAIINPLGLFALADSQQGNVLKRLEKQNPALAEKIRELNDNNEVYDSPDYLKELDLINQGIVLFILKKAMPADDYEKVSAFCLAGQEEADKEKINATSAQLHQLSTQTTDTFAH